MSNSVAYLCDTHADVTFKRKNVVRRGMLQLAPGQSADGYGRRISTDYMAFFGGKWHRIYCCCFSNAGSLYVEQGKQWLHVRDGDIPENVN